jgi:hypothetical protein
MVHPVERVKKPDALLWLDTVASRLFARLKQHFHIGSVQQLTLDSVETSSVFDDPVECAAVAMRKLQLLYLIADPDRETTSDVAFGLCVELIRELSDLQNLAPDLAFDIEAARWRLEQALVELTDLLARLPRPRAKAASRVIILGGRQDQL